jgi:hypothetical protein
MTSEVNTPLNHPQLHGNSDVEKNLDFVSPPKRRTRPPKTELVAAVRGMTTDIAINTAPIANVGGDNSEQQMLPRYRYWLGRNEFFCDGRLMLGVHWRCLRFEMMLLQI